MLSLHQVYCFACPLVWGKWVQTATEEKEAARSMHGAISRIVERQLSQSFEKWQSETEALRSQVKLLKKAVGSIVKRKLSQGFHAWHAHALESKRCQVQMRGAVVKLINGKMMTSLPW